MNDSPPTSPLRAGTTTGLAGLVTGVAHAARRAADRPDGEITERIMAARVALTIAGVVSELLHDFAPATTTRIDAFTVAAQATVATDRLDELVDADTLAEYGEGTPAADLDTLRQTGQTELHTLSDTDVERIAWAMIDLGTAVRDLMEPVAGNPVLAAKTSTAARITGDAGQMVWAHYGGDGGGW
ncbi:hypothetical protein [Saccharothrix sp. NRRL B-16348]|uniref:hypothetical protein n=1 Tax=Saccharothrix sp. NRRL B-16348 TaxID=1415542 RepID=UPI0012FCE0FC|nr:hypothetical protein [Saccharothrix sp. NRRL B-16348]